MAVTMNNDFSGMWPRVFWQVEIEVWVKYTALFIKAKEWKQCFDYLKDCGSKRPFSMYFFFHVLLNVNLSIILANQMCG